MVIVRNGTLSGGGSLRIEPLVCRRLVLTAQVADQRHTIRTETDKELATITDTKTISPSDAPFEGLCELLFRINERCGPRQVVRHDASVLVPPTLLPHGFNVHSFA